MVSDQETLSWKHVTCASISLFLYMKLVLYLIIALDTKETVKKNIDICKYIIGNLQIFVAYSTFVPVHLIHIDS